MAFADPQSFTISGTAYTLPRISSGANAGTFRTNDAAIQETVSHTYGKRNRHLLKLEQTKITTDPLNTTANVRVGMSAYVVVDLPATGFSVAEAKAVVDSLVAYLTASSGAKVTQLIGGEN